MITRVTRVPVLIVSRSPTCRWTSSSRSRVPLRTPWSTATGMKAIPWKSGGVSAALGSRGSGTSSGMPKRARAVSSTAPMMSRNRGSRGASPGAARVVASQPSLPCPAFASRSSALPPGSGSAFCPCQFSRRRNRSRIASTLHPGSPVSSPSRCHSLPWGEEGDQRVHRRTAAQRTATGVQHTVPRLVELPVLARGRRVVPVVDEEVPRHVRVLAGEGLHDRDRAVRTVVVAARLQHEHPVSGESQVGGERTSARTGADDDEVVLRPVPG